MQFVGGVFSYEPADDGELCDWWLYEDKQIPQTRLSAAVGFDRDEVKVTGITYEEMRKGCWDPKARLEDMDVNWTEAPDVLPVLPPLLRPDLHGGRGQGARRPLRQGLQRLDGRRVVRRLRRPPHPAHHHPALGRRPRRRRGPPQRRPRRAGRVLQRDPAVPRPAVDPHATTGSPSSGPAPRPAPSSTCTSARRRRCRRPRADAPAAVGLHAHLRQRHELDDRLAVLAAGSPSFPTSSSPTPRARSAGSPTSSSGPTRSGRTTGRWGGVRRQGPRAAVAPTTTARSTAASSTTSTASTTLEKCGVDNIMLRDRLPALRQHLAAHQGGRPRS